MNEAEGFKGPAITKRGLQVLQRSCLSFRHTVKVCGLARGVRSDVQRARLWPSVLIQQVTPAAKGALSWTHLEIRAA